MKFFARRIRTDFEGELYLCNGDVKVRDVLAALDEGLSRRDVLKRFKKLSENDIYTCKAMATMVMQDRPEYQRNRLNGGHPAGDLRSPIKILFDENLSWKIIPELATGDHEVSHILLEDMGGSRDIDIWNKFQSNGSRAVIITKDDDFIALAEIFAMQAMIKHGRTHGVEIEDQPFVVHVNIKKNDKDDVIAAFQRSARVFMEEATRQPRLVPYMKLKRDGVFGGATLPEIFKKFARYAKGCIPALSAGVSMEDVDLHKLNKLRRRHGLEGVSISDYPALAA